MKIFLIVLGGVIFAFICILCYEIGWNDCLKETRKIIKESRNDK